MYYKRWCSSEYMLGSINISPTFGEMRFPTINPLLQRCREHNEVYWRLEIALLNPKVGAADSARQPDLQGWISWTWGMASIAMWNCQRIYGYIVRCWVNMGTPWWMAGCWPWFLATNTGTNCLVTSWRQVVLGGGMPSVRHDIWYIWHVGFCFPMCSRRVRRTPCPFKLYKRLLTTANTQVILSCVIHHCSTHYSPTGVPLPRFELAKRHGVVEKAVEQARQQGFQEASNAVPWWCGFSLGHQSEDWKTWIHGQ